MVIRDTLIMCVTRLVYGMVMFLASKGGVQAGQADYAYDPVNRVTNAAYADGSRESYSYDAAGNRIFRVTLAAAIKVDMVPPSVPTNLVSLDFSASQLRIGWNRAFDTGGSGLAGYAVYVNGSLWANTRSTNFLLTGIAPDTDYCLTVTAYDRSTNVSALSSPLCLRTPPFQAPLLTFPISLASRQFQFTITNGTPGPYEVLVSTNLTDWQMWTNLVLPIRGGLFIDPLPGEFSQRFYRLRWSTNGP
jgi:YD repeat-containing protein